MPKMQKHISPIGSTNNKEIQTNRLQKNFTSEKVFQQHHCHEQEKSCEFEKKKT